MFVPLIAAALLAPASPPEAEKRLMLTGFDRVRIDGPFTVTVTAGSSASGRVVGDPAAVDAVQVRVDGQTLVVAPTRDDRGRPEKASARPLAIELSSDRIVGAAVRGAGRLRVDRMTGPRVDVALTGDGSIEVGAVDATQFSAMVIGAGKLTLAGRGGQGRFMVNGPGTVDAANLAIDTLLVRSEGAGGGSYRARYTADVTALGSGAVSVEGTPKCRTQGTATVRCG